MGNGASGRRAHAAREQRCAWTLPKPGAIPSVFSAFCPRVAILKPPMHTRPAEHAREQRHQWKAYNEEFGSAVLHSELVRIIRQISPSDLDRAFRPRGHLVVVPTINVRLLIYCCAVGGLVLSAPSAMAEEVSVSRIGLVETIAVDSTPSDSGTSALRNNIEILLSVTKQLPVSDPHSAADAVLRVTGVRSAGVTIEPTTRTVRLVTPTGKALWSAQLLPHAPLRSPSLAKQIVDALIAAMIKDEQAIADAVDHDVATEPAR